MAWKQGVIIRGGDLQGSFIPVQTNIVYAASSIYGTNLVAGDTDSVYDVTESYFNNDIANMINISSHFASGGALFADISIAEMAVVDENRQVTGYFCLYLSKVQDTPYMRFIIKGKVKNASGVVIGDINPSGGKEIDFQLSSADHDEPIVYLCFAETTYNDHKIFGLYVNGMQLYHGYRNIVARAYAGLYQDNEAIYTQWGIGGNIDTESKTKSPEFGPAGEEGGYGPADPGSGSTGGSGGPAPTFDGTSDPWVDTPIKPGVLAFGLLNLYKCDSGALANLGRDLFPEITWPSSASFTDIIEWLGNVIQAVSDSIWNKDLIDYIVSVHLIPVDVTSGALEDIKIGPRTMTGILARPITDDVIEIDCGTVHIDEYYTNYVDYMTRCRVYIPFYGFVQIKPEYWQSADISLKYLWNVMDGSFIAKLYSTVTRHQVPFTSMIGQYSGCACVHMPLSGANYANMFSQLAGSGAGLAAGAATGNVALAATSAMTMYSSPASAGDMQQSNSYNASSGFYGHATPYLIIERPVSHFSTGYVAEQGLPLIMTKRVGDCRGLTVCDNPILNFACSDEEAKEIKAALKEGVIV